MARPIKKGMDYFPLDTKLDLKLKLVMAKYKLVGIGFVDMLYRTIYGEGYFIELNYENILLLSDELGLPEDEFKQMLDFCVDREIFDKKLYIEKQILTSAGIQKRYFHSTTRRKKTDYEYLLIDDVDGDSEESENVVPVIEDNSGVNASNNPDNSDNNPEKSSNKPLNKRKEKENKINIPFSSFWDSYGKKVGDKTKLEKKWNKLSDEDRKAIMDYIPAYIKATPDKKYRKNPETFLNNHSWNDEIVEYAHKPGPPDLRELAISKVESNVKAMITHPERFNKYNPFDDAAQSIISHLPDVKGFDYTGLKYVLINLIENKYREEVKNAVKGIPA